MSGRGIKGERGPSALESTLGWILSGPVDDYPCTGTAEVNVVQTHVLKLEAIVQEDQTTLEEQVSKFWKLESIGVLKAEQSVYESFKEEISFTEGRYEVKLPWKPDHPVLPDNYKIS